MCIVGDLLSDLVRLDNESSHHSVYTELVGIGGNRKVFELRLRLINLVQSDGSKSLIFRGVESHTFRNRSRRDPTAARIFENRGRRVDNVIALFGASFGVYVCMWRIGNERYGFHLVTFKLAHQVETKVIDG